jgi:predicted RNA-binding protein
MQKPEAYQSTEFTFVVVRMNWLCPVKPASWKIIKKREVFGAPKQALNAMQQVKIGDNLVFCVLGKEKRIVSIYSVTTTLYEDNSDIWGKYRYPLRVRIKPINGQNLRTNFSIPLSSIYGGNSNSDFIIEPFLKNIWIVKMENNQYLKLQPFFLQGN